MLIFSVETNFIGWSPKGIRQFVHPLCTCPATMNIWMKTDVWHDRTPSSTCRSTSLPADTHKLHRARDLSWLNRVTCAKDTLAERLRHRPAKPMGSPRVGSNPTGVDSCLSFPERTLEEDEWWARSSRWKLVEHNGFSVQDTIKCLHVSAQSQKADSTLSASRPVPQAGTRRAHGRQRAYAARAQLGCNDFTALVLDLEATLRLAVASEDVADRRATKAKGVTQKRQR